ncbi:MAG: cytochrome P450, partial [Myxococcota bacterium]|nr:cytochrome P450 [Myxococcota bacterium]
MTSDPLQKTSPPNGKEPVAGFFGANPEDPDYQQDPYPGYFELRESQPVNLTPWGHWRISRYEDC